jgi:hypothetical protein
MAARAGSTEGVGSAVKLGVMTSNFAERYCEAIRAWAAAHPGVTLMDLANEHDAQLEAGSKALFAAHPELTLENILKQAASRR